LKGDLHALDGCSDTPRHAPILATCRTPEFSKKGTETANTSHDAWRWKNVKKKNDKEDALKLAKLSPMNPLPLTCGGRNSSRSKLYKKGTQWNWVRELG
jgi:hypothetical protein